MLLRHPPEENCATGSPDAISYAALAGWLALSIWDAGRAAERSNARRRRGVALLVGSQPGRGRSGHRVGLTIPLGGHQPPPPDADVRRD